MNKLHNMRFRQRISPVSFLPKAKWVFCFLFALGGALQTVSAGQSESNTAQNVTQQKKKITGKVKDEKGESLIGVTIAIKGKTTGTVTDLNGNYSLDVAPGDVLVVSYIGYNRQTIPVNGKTNINISMEQDSKGLDEVVVVGYATVKKAHLTGAVAAVKASDVEALPVGNLGASLSGRLPGVEVSGGTSRPGTAASLSVRSYASYSKDGGSSEPLYVIDGILQNDGTAFNNLDANEVESISVLKDASAAIYGARAARGVILVSTKKGKEGVARVSYSYSYANQDEFSRAKMLNAYEYGVYQNKYWSLSPIQTDKKKLYAEDELEQMKTVNYDWLDDAWQSAGTQKHSVNVTGGAQKATYFASASYYDQGANLGYQDYSKWNFRAGTDVQLASRLKAGLQVSGYSTSLTKMFNKLGGENVESDYATLIQMPRFIPAYNNGLPVNSPVGASQTTSGYHFFEVERLGNKSITKSNSLSVNFNAEYDLPFVKGLKAKVVYGRSFNNGWSSQVGTNYTLYSFTGTGTNNHIIDGATTYTSKSYSNGNRLGYQPSYSDSYQYNFMLTYNKTFGKHSIDALVAYEQSEAVSEQINTYKSDPIQNTNGMLATAFGSLDASNTKTESGTQSYLGRVNYNYANKYLAEFLIRTDASTKFAPTNYWGTFPSMSLGWVASEEKFMKSNWMDYLKLRASFGLTGTDNTAAWLWRQRYTTQDGKGIIVGGSDNNGTTLGMKMEASPNPNVTWDNEFQFNGGVDFRTLNSKLSLGVDGYNYRGWDMLMSRTSSVPITVGGTTASENFGKVDRFGVELNLGWKDKIGKDFTYGINTSFSWSDRIIRQGNFEAIVEPWDQKIGESDDNGTWGYRCLGMFKSQADIDNYVSNYNITKVTNIGGNSSATYAASALKVGMLYYEDVRGARQADGTYAGPDGIIDANDQIQLSKKTGNHYGFSVNLNCGWKGFRLDAMIGGSFGGYAAIDGRVNPSKSTVNVPEYWSDMYNETLNPNGKYPNTYYFDLNNEVSDFWMVSAFRMSMRNINLSYTVPTSIVKKAKLESCKVFLTGMNMFDFYNPFSYKSASSNYAAFPTLRTISAGVNLVF